MSAFSAAVPSPDHTVPTGGRTRATRTTLTVGEGVFYYPPAWWLDPLKAILFVVLPIFCFAAYLNQFNYWTFNASEDFVTPQTFGLGLYSMGLLIVGILIGRLSSRRRDLVSIIDANRASVVLTRLALVTIFAHLLLLGSLVTQIGLVLELIRGNAEAATEVRAALGRIPGITSFVQLDVVYLALTSALVILTEFRVNGQLRVLTIIVIGLTFLRSVLASERLALLEALAAIVVVPIAYRWRPSLWRSLSPFIGILFVFVAFAAGEYFRSWQYYQYYYDSYFDFITQRFAGYFSTSINNGAGAYQIYGGVSRIPQITSGWVTKFPIIGQHITGNELPILDQFLETYATPEFNNPGGPYAAFLDYKFWVATLFMTTVGVVIGLVHRGFQNKSLRGLVLYPVIFLGLTDLIRILYISDTRTLPIFLGAFVTVWSLRSEQMPRSHYQILLAAPRRVDGQ